MRLSVLAPEPSNQRHPAACRVCCIIQPRHLARVRVRAYTADATRCAGVRVDELDGSAMALSASGGVRFLAPVRRRLPKDERRVICGSRAARRWNVRAIGPRAGPGALGEWVVTVRQFFREVPSMSKHGAIVYKVRVDQLDQDSSLGCGPATIMRSLPGARARVSDLTGCPRLSASGGVRFLAPFRRRPRMTNDDA